MVVPFYALCLPHVHFFFPFKVTKVLNEKNWWSNQSIKEKKKLDKWHIWWSKKWNTPSRTKDSFFITKHDLSCGQLSCILSLFRFVFLFIFSLYKTQYDEWKCVFFFLKLEFFFWLKLNKDTIWSPLKRWIYIDR